MRGAGRLSWSERPPCPGSVSCPSCRTATALQHGPEPHHATCVLQVRNALMCTSGFVCRRHFAAPSRAKSRRSACLAYAAWPARRPPGTAASLPTVPCSLARHSRYARQTSGDDRSRRIRCTQRPRDPSRPMRDAVVKGSTALTCTSPAVLPSRSIATCQVRSYACNSVGPGAVTTPFLA